MIELHPVPIAQWSVKENRSGLLSVSLLSCYSYFGSCYGSLRVHSKKLPSDSAVTAETPQNWPAAGKLKSESIHTYTRPPAEAFFRQGNNKKQLEVVTVCVTLIFCVGSGTSPQSCSYVVFFTPLVVTLRSFLKRIPMRASTLPKKEKTEAITVRHEEKKKKTTVSEVVNTDEKTEACDFKNRNIPSIG